MSIDVTALCHILGSKGNLDLLATIVANLGHLALHALLAAWKRPQDFQSLELQIVRVWYVCFGCLFVCVVCFFLVGRFSLWKLVAGTADQFQLTVLLIHS